MIKIKKEQRFICDTKRKEWWVLILFNWAIRISKYKDVKYFAAETWVRADNIKMHDMVGCEGYVIGQTGARYSGYVMDIERYRVKVNFAHVDHERWVRKKKLQKLKLTYIKDLVPGPKLSDHSESFGDMISLLWVYIMMSLSKKQFVQFYMSGIYVVCNKKSVLAVQHYINENWVSILYNDITADAKNLFAFYNPNTISTVDTSNVKIGDVIDPWGGDGSYRKKNIVMDIVHNSDYSTHFKCIYIGDINIVWKKMIKLMSQIKIDKI